MRSDEATGKEPPLQGHREKWTRLTGQLKSGDHLCAIYETPEQLWATMVPLLRDGLAKNEKVVYIVAHHTATEILDMLTTAGVPAHDTLRTGQLEIFSWDDTYLAGGYFNPDQVIETFRKLEADSLAAGWSALRVTGEMTWVLSKPPEVERLIEYEAKLNHFFPGSRTLAICQYWEEKFDARILLDVIRTHPIVIAGDIVCENLFYEPPDEFLAVTDAPVPRAAYRRRLAGIRDRARTLEALRQERDFNRTLIHASPAFFVAIDAAGKTLLMNDTMLRALGYAGDEVVGTDYLTTFVPEGDRAELAQVFTRLTSLGQPTVNENRVRAKDGREFLVEWHGRSMLKEDGTLDCFFGVGIDITARRKTEEELRRVNRALQVLSQCSEAVIQAAEEEPLLEEICRIVVETGGYRWAWIGVIGEDAEKAVLPIAQAGVDEGYVKTLGVTWADAARGRGLTRTALRTGKPAVARDILTDPRFGPWQEEATRRGYASSAALPLIAEGQTLGILNVYAAEPDAFSDEEVALLMRLATVVAYGMAALHARAARDLAEAQLRHRAKLEQAITQISTRFTTLAPQEVDREIARALQEIGTFAQADRSHVFQFSPDGEYMVNTHDWCAPGIEPPLQHLQALPVEAYPWWMGRLRRGELIHVPRVRELPEEARAERELLLAQGTQSVLAVPVAVGTSLIGFLRVDSVRAEKGWPQDAVTLLGIVGEVIAGALHRKRTEEALRESKERYRGLFEDAPVALLEEDFSQVKQAVDELRARGITDFRAYLDAHPEVVADWAARVKILRFNKAVLDLFGAKSGEEIQALHAQAAGEVLDTSREEFIALAEGKTELNQDGIALDLAGNRHTVRVQLTVPPGARERWDRVLLSLTDVTEQMRLRQQLQRQVQQLEALRQLDLTITGILDLRMTLDVLLDQVVRGLGADAADVLLVNPQHQTLEFAAAHGLRSGALPQVRLRLGQGPPGRAALERRPVSVPDLQESADFSPHLALLRAEGFTSYLAVPIVAKGQAMGLLELFYRDRHEPDRDSLAFLEMLAGQVAIAIDNTRMLESLQASRLELSVAYDATIEGWVQALDLRDKETEGHTLRVTEMTLDLARALGVREEELPHIRRGALLHDIGKMAIPDAILRKPGPLTDEEWDLMRRHPVFAYELLSPIAYLRPALTIPYCHHEKWDGTGYPRGLNGEEIPLPARIFAVVDVYDALTSDRPYRPAWPREKALAYIRDQAGKHFDPRVVRAFLELVDKAGGG